jgi:hypothetical protein
MAFLIPEPKISSAPKTEVVPMPETQKAGIQVPDLREITKVSLSSLLKNKENAIVVPKEMKAAPVEEKAEVREPVVIPEIVEKKVEVKSEPPLERMFVDVFLPEISELTKRAEALEALLDKRNADAAKNEEKKNRNQKLVETGAQIEKSIDSFISQNSEAKLLAKLKDISSGVSEYLEELSKSIEESEKNDRVADNKVLAEVNALKLKIQDSLKTIGGEGGGQRILDRIKPIVKSLEKMSLRGREKEGGEAEREGIKKNIQEGSINLMLKDAPIVNDLIKNVPEGYVIDIIKMILTQKAN